MLGIQERVHETMVEFNELCSFTPHPDPSKLDRIFEICAYAMGFSVDEMSQMTGPSCASAPSNRMRAARS